MEADNNLRKHRKARGLAIMGLVAKSGVSYNLISGIENWKLKPTSDVQQRLAKALSVDVSDIWPDAGETSDPYKAGGEND